MALLRCLKCRAVRPPDLTPCPLCQRGEALQVEVVDLVVEVSDRLPSPALAGLHALLVALEGGSHVWQ
jgi:hypothetical protein